MINFPKSNKQTDSKQENLKDFECLNANAAQSASSFHAALLNTIKQAVIATELDGTVIYWNEFAEQLYGWSAEDSIGRNIIELLVPESNAQHANEIMTRLSQRKSWSGEFKVKRKDGTAFPAQITNSPIYDAEGILIGVVGLSNDISERKRYEKSLYESENKYRTLVEQASDGIHTYDPAGNFLEVNSKLCEMVGYSSKELLRLNVRDLVPPEDLVADPIRFEELIRGKTLIKERRLRRKDGTFIPVEISGRMIRDGVLQAIIRDVSDRKTAEEKLKQNEQRLRAMFESSHDGILVEFEERINYVNKSYTRLFGYDEPEELTGKHISVVIAADDLERVLTFGADRVNGRESPASYEFKGRKKDGTSIDVEASVSMSNAAGQNYITTMIRDVGERRRLEESLRDYANQLRLITDTVPLLISYVDKDHHYRFVNLSYTEWFGIPKENVVGRHLSDVLGEEAYQAILPEVERALSGEEVRFERSVPYKNGERFIHVSYIPEIETRTGVVKGFNAFVQDISESKRAEKTLRRSHEDLEEMVFERTRELEKSNEERIKLLRRLVRAQEDERRRLARDLHDHLGQQMTLLRIELENLKKMCKGDAALCGQVDEARKVLRQLDSDVDTLARKMRPIILDELGVVPALEQYVNNWSKSSNIATKFQFNRFGKTPITKDAETHLYRIVQEALNNVYKHAQAKTVSISLEPREDSALLIIEDDGAGFETGESILSGDGAKGMGLIGMRERAALVDGTFEIESSKGKGTTLFVGFPISKGEREGK